MLWVFQFIFLCCLWYKRRKDEADNIYCIFFFFLLDAVDGVIKKVIFSV